MIEASANIEEFLLCHGVAADGHDFEIHQYLATDSNRRHGVTKKNFTMRKMSIAVSADRGRELWRLHLAGMHLFSIHEQDKPYHQMLQHINLFAPGRTFVLTRAPAHAAPPQKSKRLTITFHDSRISFFVIPLIVTLRCFDHLDVSIGVDRSL